MRLLRPTFRLIADHRRAFVAVNLLGYGLLVAGMITGLVFPSLSEANAAGLDADGTTEQVLGLIRNPALFAVMIFAVNLFTVALSMVTLPSLVIPFAGIPVFAWKAFDMGITLAPTGGAESASYLIPHSLTMIIEYGAYNLLMFGAYLHAMAWLRPRTVEEPNHRRGYLRGLQRFGRVWIVALVLFVIGAVYEALSLSYLVPWMAGVMAGA